MKFLIKFAFFFLAAPLSLHAQLNSEVDQILLDSLSKIGSTPVVVVNKDGIIYQKDGLPTNLKQVSITEPVPLASCTKILSAVVIMSLIDDGTLNPYDTIGKFFPGVGPQKSSITLLQLMSHTSGFGGNSTFLGANYTLKQSVDSILINDPLAYTPGIGFLYGGVSMQIAGQMAVEASGENWDNLFNSRVASKCDMPNTNYGSGSNRRIAGGAIGSAIDIARLMQMLLNNGISHTGQRVLSEEAVKYMLGEKTFGAEIISSPYEAIDAASAKYRYAFGNWIEKFEPNSGFSVVNGSQGAFGACPWVDRTKGVGGIVLSGRGFSNITPTYREIRRIAASYQSTVFHPEYRAIDFPYAKASTSSEEVYFRGVSIDDTGNTVLCGSFKGNFSFSDNITTSAGGSDILIASLSPQGNIRWLKSLGGSGSDLAYDVVSSPEGIIYVTGTLTGNQTIGDIEVSADASGNTFTAAFDQEGEVLWVHSPDGEGLQGGNEIALDPMGNLLSVSFSTGDVIYPDMTFTNQGQYDVLIERIDGNGNLLKAIAIGGTGVESGRAIASDNNGNILVGGGFNSYLSVQGNELNPVGETDGYVMKFDTSGNLIWQKQIGSEGNNEVRGIVSDDNGNVYISGYFTGSVWLDGYNITSSANSQDLFLARLDQSGNTDWIRQFGGPFQDEGSELEYNNGKLYLAGTVFPEVWISGSPIINESTNRDEFIAIYDTNGDLERTSSWGVNGTNVNYALAYNQIDSSLYTVGSFIGSGNLSSETFVSDNPGAYLVKWTGTEVVTSLIGLETAPPENLIVWPNPTAGNIYYELDNTEPVSIYNMMGEQIEVKSKNKSLDLSLEPDGIYILRAGDRFVRVIKY